MIFISCYHPCFIQKFVDPYNKEDFETKFISSEVAQRTKECQYILAGKYQGSSTVDDFYFGMRGGKLIQFIQIPCGKCIGCRIDYKRSWADRLTYHSLDKEYCYFLTLTYDDQNMDHLYYNSTYDIYSIDFNDITEFIKKLRNHFRDQNIDYFYSMEYGDSNFRCHAHLILFNVPFDDLEYIRLDDQGQPVFTSLLVDKLWQKGIHTISKFSWLNAAYTAGYVEKKLYGRRQDEYLALGLQPEGCRMSRRPGIAYDYYMDHYQDIWKNGGLDVDRSVNSSGKLGIPRYFRKLAEKKGYDDFLAWQKRTNEKSNILNPLKVEQSSFDLGRVRDMLAFEERTILSRQKNREL